MNSAKLWALKVIAVISLALGVIGVFVPGLPTVPFVLLAAWAASRSSPRLSAWLEAHARYGPMIRQWRERGVVGRSAKWTATAAMAISVAVLFVTVSNPWFAGGAGACMALVLLWLWRRPEA